MRIKWLKKENISQLPKTAGVYFFKRGREILYIGKAGNLKKRAKSHFENKGPKDAFLIKDTEKVGFLKTDSEIEALVLEAKLIKKYRPRHNVVWRDDKNYFFLAKTKEDFPLIFITHQPKKNERIEYVGPFVDGRALKQSLKALRKIFPYRSCKRIPKRPCLWHQLQRCPAPCLLFSFKSESLKKNFLGQTKKISGQNAKNLFNILKGKKTLVLKGLRKKMKEFSEKAQFEKAAEARDQLFALKRVLAHSRVLADEFFQEKINYQEIEKELRKVLKAKKKILRIEGYDVSCFQGKEAVGSMAVFIEGIAEKSLFRRFKIKTVAKANDPAMIKECLLRRFGHPEWDLPDMILIDGGKGQLSASLSAKKEALLKKTIKLAALAKKENRLYIENKKGFVFLKDLPPDLGNLLLRIRDQAHSFGLSYHKKLREKKLLK